MRIYLIGLILFLLTPFTCFAQDDMEVMIMNQNSTIGLYEKLELGIKLPEEVNNQVEGFLNNAQLDRLNPYDPDQVNMEATFKNENGTYHVFGFYFKDYNRNNKSNNNWYNIATTYEWRIRFAPPAVGKWTCDISVDFPNSDLERLTINDIEFECKEQGKMGFIKVSEDKRHFKYDDPSGFFIPIGQNIPWTDEPIFKGRWLNSNEDGFSPPNKDFKNKLRLAGFQDILDYINNAADNNGNCIRIVSWHHSYLFEWEERGVYGSNRNKDDQQFLRQKRAWELDKLFETAESRDLKLIFNLEFQGQFCYNWEDGSYYSYKRNPYNYTTDGENKVLKTPPDFFSEAELINAYKKKLRYFIARWGYSPSLGIFQLLSEFDGWGINAENPNKRINDVLDKDAPLQQNIKNWHETISNYIHQIVYRPIIVSSGFMTNTKPLEIPIKRNLYTLPGIDMVIWNRYGNGRSIHYEMFLEANAIMDKFDKPYLFTETGIIMDPVSNSDPGDVEGCDDLIFHNFAWAGIASGCAGTNFEWWQPFDNKRRIHFQAIHRFIESIPFDSAIFDQPDRWNDNGTGLIICGRIKRKLKKTSLAEGYFVNGRNFFDNKKIDMVYGWVHNLTSYWQNQISYTSCKDRNNKSPKKNNCDDDVYDSPINLQEKQLEIKIKGLVTNSEYKLDWYSTVDKGGIVNSLMVKTTGSGMAKIIWPGPNFDYAFKLTLKK